MSQFIGLSMPRGYAGEITRGSFDHTIEAKANDSTAPVTAAGVALKLTNAGAVTPVTAGATDTVFGIAVRIFSQAGNSHQIVDVLKRGYIAVQVASGTPAIGGQVYLTSAGKFSATSTDTALTGAKFCGAKDAEGLAEIAFNI